MKRPLKANIVKLFLFFQTLFQLLELPLEDDNFKLVLVVPNEKDTLHNLVRTLTLEGLEQAVNLIQPLFTFTSELDAPKVLIDSELVSGQLFVKLVLAMNHKHIVQCLFRTYRRRYLRWVTSRSPEIL